MFKRILICMLLCGFISALFSPSIAMADVFPTTGTTDGTYNFGGLDNLGGVTGFTRLGDKFKVANGMFSQYQSYNSGPPTAIYPLSPDTGSYTDVIMTEGGSVCKTFTFKDLGVSGYSFSGYPVNFNSLDIVLKDIAGAQIGSTISLGSSLVEIPTTSVINISALYNQGPWSVDGVAAIEITYSILEGGIAAAAWDLNLENITIANVSAASLPTVTGISPSSGSAFGGTSVIINGTDFNGASAVKFGGSVATSYNVDSPTRISAVSPAGIVGQIDDITVTTLVGQSATSSTDEFTYTQDQAYVAGEYYSIFAEALSAALSGAEVRAYGSLFDGNFIMDKGIVLKGGYDYTFLAKGNNSPTILNGSLTVKSGASTAETVVVKGKLAVQGGSLRVKDVKVMQ